MGMDPTKCHYFMLQLDLKEFHLILHYAHILLPRLLGNKQMRNDVFPINLFAS